MSRFLNVAYRTSPCPTALETLAPHRGPRGFRSADTAPRRGRSFVDCVSIAFLCLFAFSAGSFAESLPNTKPLEDKDDLAMKMVAGIDKYLTRGWLDAPESARQYWKPNFSVRPRRTPSRVEPNRQRLKKILGIVDRAEEVRRH